MKNFGEDLKAGWEPVLASTLALFGHRNWIVVADSAYPAQSRPGIQTVLSDGDHLATVSAVLDAIGRAPHVRPIVYTDLELEHVPDVDAPGITALREGLRTVLGALSVRRLMHEEIIARLDGAAEMFQILIVKTPLTIPYTSVFFELDCGYWDADAERRLREAIAASGAR